MGRAGFGGQCRDAAVKNRLFGVSPRSVCVVEARNPAPVTHRPAGKSGRGGWRLTTSKSTSPTRSSGEAVIPVRTDIPTRSTTAVWCQAAPWCGWMGRWLSSGKEISSVFPRGVLHDFGADARGDVWVVDFTNPPFDPRKMQYEPELDAEIHTTFETVWAFPEGSEQDGP